MIIWHALVRTLHLFPSMHVLRMSRSLSQGLTIAVSFLISAGSVAYGHGDSLQRPVAWESAPRASGAFGAVYRGTDAGGRAIAGKQMKDQNAARQEAQILRKLSGYDGFPRYHDVWDDNGRSTVLMNWVEGKSVHAWIRRSVSKSARIVSRLLIHVEELHRRGYVHQDIKPDNVRINDRDRSRSLTLLDFGQAVELEQTWNGASGTIEYRAPEQDHSGIRTRATDVYGAASFFLYLLNGRHPFPQARALFDASDWSALAVHRAERAEVNHVTDPGLRSVLWKALSPNPADRYQTADEFRLPIAPHKKSH